jgi:predicted HicB family RNase H-like nuclease
MMEYKGYLGAVEFDDEANLFHGEVVNVRDVITFQGTTVPEIRRAFHESVDDYLAFCRERGEEPDRPLEQELVRIAGSHLTEIKKTVNALLLDLASRKKSNGPPVKRRRR